MRKFDTNETWNEDEVCNECKSDDLREDHAFECDCYCHHPAQIRSLRSEVERLKGWLANEHQENVQSFIMHKRDNPECLLCKYLLQSARQGGNDK